MGRVFLSIRFSGININGMSSYCTYGHPSPMTFHMFAHALSSRMGTRLASGVLPIIHSFNLNCEDGAEDRKYLHQLRSTSRDSRGISQVDVPRANIKCTVIFAIEGGGEEINKSLVESKLLCMRFGGGTIHPDGIRVDISKTSSELLSRGKPGYVMNIVKEDLTGDNGLKKLASHMLIRAGKRGWRSASLLGYSLLNINENVDVERLNPDEPERPVAHAFAEPLIGMLEFVFIRRGMGSEDFNASDFEALSWRYSRIGNLIQITQKG